MQVEDQTVVKVDNLTWRYPRMYGKEYPLLYNNLNVDIKKGQRVVLVGANGAGKSTLLRLIAGKHMVEPQGAVTVEGRNAFADPPAGIGYVGGNWSRTVAFAGYDVPYQADVPVGDMVRTHLKTSVEMSQERVDKLVDVLGIDLQWRMHQVSDGQRRRVQILLGLMKPYSLLLLDEVTTDLDVLRRQDLLNFLKEETETRGCTIIYATHIFDGLEDWASSIMMLGLEGTLVHNYAMADIPGRKEMSVGISSPLLRIVENWLRTEEDRYSAKLAAKAAEADTPKEAKKEKYTEPAYASQFQKSESRFYNYWGS